MIAIAGGLVAALAWTVTTLSSARASRSIGALPTLAWVMLVGLVPAVAAVLAVGGTAPDGGQLGWLLAAGLGNVAGLGLVYAAVRRGQVGVVAPIASTEGAVAAVIAIALGEHLSPGVATALAVVVVGVVLAAAARGSEGRTAPGAVVFACSAALAFGASIYATGRVSQELSIAWAMLPARAVGVALVTLPLLVAGRLRPPRGERLSSSSPAWPRSAASPPMRSVPGTGSRSPRCWPRSSRPSRRSARSSSTGSG